MSEEKTNLEKVIAERKKIIETVMHKFLGVSIKELNEDITSRLSSSTDYIIDISIKYKEAKKFFLKSYLEKILKQNLGNISEAALNAKISRRTIHRMINEFNIPTEQIRKEIYKPEYAAKDYVNKIIEKSIKKYDNIIHPAKITEMYQKVDIASEDILKSIPEQKVTLKDAESEFEKEYIIKLITECKGNQTLAAKISGLRYETIHRKIKKIKSLNI